MPNINVQEPVEISVSIHEGIGSKSGKPYSCIKLVIGDWETLVFPQTKFELDYIRECLSKNS